MEVVHGHKFNLRKSFLLPIQGFETQLAPWRSNEGLGFQAREVPPPVGRDWGRRNEQKILFRMIQSCDVRFEGPFWSSQVLKNL
jgi:hypothetical protein